MPIIRRTRLPVSWLYDVPPLLKGCSTTDLGQISVDPIGVEALAKDRSGLFLLTLDIANPVGLI